MRAYLYYLSIFQALFMLYKRIDVYIAYNSSIKGRFRPNMTVLEMMRSCHLIPWKHSTLKLYSLGADPN